MKCSNWLNNPDVGVKDRSTAGGDLNNRPLYEEVMKGEMYIVSPCR